jgi:succinoglycan biosynthesis transport protein ExoP
VAEARQPRLRASVLGLVDSVLSVFQQSAGPLPILNLLSLGQRYKGFGRVGVTYVISVGFRTQDPQRVAKIANAVADAYIVDQLEAKYQATLRAGTWMQDRIKELRTQATNAERAMEDFKAKNNIVAASGRLINEQQLSDSTAR